MSTSYLLLAIAAFLVAGTIKGVVGIGLPVTSVGILGQFGDARLAITLAILPIVLTNIWQVHRTGGFLRTVRTYWLMAVPMIVVLFITALLAPHVPTYLLTLTIGTIIVIFSLLHLLGHIPHLPDHWDKPAQVIAGTLSGVFGGLTAIWAPPLLVYFLSRNVEKDDFVRSIGTMFILGSLPLLAGYVQNGSITGSTALVSLALVIPTIAGFAIGERLRRRMPAERFRTATLVVFLIIGISMVLRTFIGG